MRAPPERVCFVHAGTHKTATTALQNYLSENEALLAAEGTYYPRSGRMHPNGHHNIAFELSGDERYQPALGGLAQLLDEVAAAGPPRACISSEGLTFLNDRPDKLAALRDGFAAIGYRTVVVVYLRAQSEYLESLYPTLLKLGYPVSFEAFVERALSEGVVRYRGNRSYRFDYAGLLERYAQAFGANGVIVRRYAKHADPSWIVRDFFAAIGPPAHHPERSPSGPRLVNPRPGLSDSARMLLRNRERAPSPQTELVLGHFAGLPFAPLGVLPAARLVGRFGAGNQRVARRWGRLIAPVRPRLVAARAWGALDPGSPQRAARALLSAVERDSA